jgi:hypothetical protein
MADLTDITDVIPPVQLNKLETTPFDITYVLPAVDFSTTATEVIETPAGFRGVVKAITVYNVTTQFTAVTTPAYVYVGITGDTDAYVTSASLGTLDADEADCPALTRGATYIIPAGQTVDVTGVAPTGGSPAGVATIGVTIQFFR